MKRTFRILACVVGLSVLAGCTIAEPAYRPDLGGYAMIREKKQEKTVVSNQKVQPSSVTRS